ncbi:tetratricopeptide repeat protein [Terriglobus sp. RCC_193]|uniref:tetratricopeptide repeat protein n=1 Tax=Terriglobus sp. RCC_193 TaxID=3239218 RepID=UPI0035233032
MHRTLRIVPATLALAAVLFTAPTPAFAANKEMVELQTQVRALQDAIARLQQSNDERMGVMKDLIQQTTDAVNKMAQNMDGVQRQMRAQSEGTGKNVEQLSGQMQSLNDSLDELKARLGRIEKNIGDVQSQQQSISSKMDSGGVAGGGAPMTTDTPSSGNAPAPIVRNGKPSAAIPAAPALPTAPSAPPVEDLYRTAFSDYNGAKYTLASAEFNDVIKYYPDSNLAGNAYFYLGEIDYKAGRFSAAAKNYDKVAEQYPGNPKTAVSQLRKGESLLALKQTDAGVRELRSLIQRYPNTQEATAARSKLNALGVTVVPRNR